MNRREFDNLLHAVRDDVPGDQVVRDAGIRVRARIEAGLEPAAQVARLESCADFRALLPAFRNRELSEARRMLVEDHLHSCVACRRVLHGERPAAIPIRERKRVWRAAPWAIAAAAIVVAYFALPALLDRIMAPSDARATVASVNGELYRVSDAGSTLLTAGAAIQENQEIRTAPNSRAVLRLRDGSTVEMAGRSDVRLSERWRGKTVHLARGAVMIEAARQRLGRLEVATPDCLVSVKGTIFEVASGTKGSKVSVVEGEVKVDQDGGSALLHRGDQKTTSPSMAKTSVADDVAWSRNAAKYLALLGELSEVGKRIEQIPGPGVRYESKLARLLPENTMIFASIPNLETTLTEAVGVFEDRVRSSEVLREWWSEKQTQQLRAMVDQVRTFSDYLGDEIVLAVPSGENAAPLVIAQVRRPELRDFLATQFAGLRGSGAPLLIENPATPITTSHGPLVMVHGGVVAMAGRPETLASIASIVDAGSNAGGQSGFLSTPFWKRISQSYRTGAEWAFAMNMEQIAGPHVPKSNMTDTAGLDNVRYLMIERKPNLGRTENSASLSFAGARHGLASWLAAPGPMGTLDFVSPDATFAASFVIKNPATLLGELISLAGAQTALAQIEQQTGANPVTDLAANMGGEITVALDGPLLPTPAWKAAIEVENPSRIEWAIEQGVAAARHNYPVTLANTPVNGLTYYTLTSPKLAYEIDYTFTDGYLLIAPTPALLSAAIANRAAGVTLEHSAAFRAQLPQDGHTNFSALLYYNAGSTLAPVVDQLKSGGLMTPEQEKSAALLTSNREPGLVYAYGEPDRIVVASRGGFFGLGLDTLVGLNAKGAAALPQLLPPILQIHGSSH